MLTFRHQKGFTLVELLITIAVIGVLAAIGIVAYVGVQDRAQETSVKVDLANIAKQVEVYKTELGHYPSTTEIQTLGIKVNKQTYGVNPTGATGFYCVNTGTDAGSVFSIVTRVKSQMILKYNSNDGETSEYSGSQNAPQLCIDSGVSNPAYLNFTENGQWEDWIDN